MTPTFSDLAEAQYLLLTTFTKDGRPKPVPIWAALDTDRGDRLLVITEKKSWKVKRIRNTPRVTLATCTLRGRPTSEAVEATAAILDESQTGAVYDAIVKRYGIQGKLFTFVSKLRGGMRNNIGLELKVAESETGWLAAPPEQPANQVDHKRDGGHEHRHRDSRRQRQQDAADGGNLGEDHRGRDRGDRGNHDPGGRRGGGDQQRHHEECPDDLDSLGGYHAHQCGEHNSQGAHWHAAGGRDLRIDGGKQERSVADRQHGDHEQTNHGQHGQPGVTDPDDLAGQQRKTGPGRFRWARSRSTR